MPSLLLLCCMQKYPTAYSEIGEVVAGRPVSGFENFLTEPSEIFTLLADVVKIDWHNNPTQQIAHREEVMPQMLHRCQL